MEGALEWDVIGSLRLQNRPRVESLVQDLIPRLEKKHRARVATDPDFRRLEKEVELLREVSADTVVSLDLETRRSEQEEYDGRRRAIIDEWRVARGYPPMPPEEDDEDAAEGTEGASDEAGSGLGADPDAADELDEDSPEARALRGPRRVDAWLQEAARILVDAIEDGYTGV
jgi:carboxyl-terminal processing protease